MAFQRNRGYGQTFLCGCLFGCIIASIFYNWIGLGVTYRMSLEGNQYHSQNQSHSGRSPVINANRTLGVFVFTAAAKLPSTARIVNQTWGSGETDYRIVFGGNSNIPHEWRTLPIMHLKQEQEFSSSQPTVHQLFSLLKFLCKKYIGMYDWFLLASSEVYVATRDLEKLLSKLDPHTVVYMGRPGSQNPIEMASLRMMVNEYFCEGGPGIILSHTALEAIVPFLDECLKQVQSYSTFSHSDVELGRCFSRKLDVHCSTSQEALDFFVYDMENNSVHPEQLWFKPEFQHLLTLYPVWNATHMRSIHHFCKVREFEWYRQKLRASEKMVNRVCRTLPREFRAPVTKDCNLNAFHTCPVQPASTQSSSPPLFSVQNETDFQSWQYVEGDKLFTSGNTIPVTDSIPELQEELEHVITKVLKHINKDEDSELRFVEIESGYIRYSGTRGKEYVLDLSLYGQEGNVQRRVNLLWPHMPQVVVLPDTGIDRKDTCINFVVPLNGVGTRFSEFLKVYEHVCLMNGENVRLVLAVYGKDDQISVRKSVQEYKKKYPGSKFRIVYGEGQFSRGRALDRGLSVLNGNELAFICDVDMTFDLSFLRRCRLNTIQGSRVYYPEFFKYYNMDYVYRFKRKPQTYNIRREHGHWATYSYGMLCIYKSDYTAIGGFDTSIVGWGGEDVELVGRVIRHRLEVFKAPDPSLSHRYHDKICSTHSNPIQFSDCISSRKENLADEEQLGEYVLKLEEEYGISHPGADA